MDTIWNVAFGMDKNIQNNPDDEYFTKAEEFFSSFAKLDTPSFLGIYLHEIKHNIVDILLFASSIIDKINRNKTFLPQKWIKDRIYECVEKRKQTTTPKKDFIQMLINTQADNQEIGEEYDRKLSLDEVKANLTDFLLAGYETTSNILSYCTYVLSIHSNEQQTILDEIKATFPTMYSNEKEHSFSINLETLGIDEVNKMKYLDMFIKEVLRMFPIGLISRRCTNATIVKGIEFHEGMVIDVDMKTIHYDPEVWGPEDTQKFYPSRHDVKRHPCAFLGFGLGPKNCAGMKFALMELKMTLVKLIVNFEISKSENTPVQLEYCDGIVRIPKDGIRVAIKKRIF